MDGALAALLLYPLVAIAAISDGTLGAWLLENGAVFALVALKCVAERALATVDGVDAMLAFGATNAIIVEGAVLLQALLNATVYRATPSFHDKPPNHGARGMALGIAYATLPVHVASTVATSAMLQMCYRYAVTPEVDCVAPHGAALELSRVDIATAKFVAFRVVSDAIFYATHYLQHRVPRLFSWAHARHHQHRRTSLRTNFQFTPVDLLLEGSLPSLGAAFLLGCAGVRLTALELELCLAYVQWYQIGSHSSKDVPIVTAVPPLAPLYNHTLAKRLRPPALREHRHIRFHAAHHRVVTKNFGISPWLDYALGTYSKR